MEVFRELHIVTKRLFTCCKLSDKRVESVGLYFRKFCIVNKVIRKMEEIFSQADLGTTIRE